MKFIKEDIDVLDKPVPKKLLPWQPLFQKPFFVKFYINLLKMHFHLKFFYSNGYLNRLDKF